MAILSGLIAAGAAIGGAAISNSGTKAAAQSAQASADQAAQVQRDMYNQSAQTLAPYVQAGLPATQHINALLGLSQPQQQVPTGLNTLADFSQLEQQYPGVNSLAQMYGGQQQRQGGGNVTTTPVTANAAFDAYRGSTGYDFRLKQGIGAVTSGFAGLGTLQSGAARLRLVDYGQGIASQEFGNYLGALGSQQSLGLSAASAQAGVGQNYANSLGNIYQQNGANQANAALVRSQNTVNAIGQVGGILTSQFGGGQQQRPLYYNPVMSNVPNFGNA